MSMDKSWMYGDRVSPLFRDGLKAFIDHAAQFLNEEEKIHCPCKMCCNMSMEYLDVVYAHCFDKGFVPEYTTWFYHGEEMAPVNKRARTVVDESGDEMALVINDFMGRAPEEEVLKTEDDDNIDELISKLHEDVFPGCKKSSALKFLADLMHIKVLYKWPNESFDVLLMKLKEVLPEGSNLPDSFYKAKTLLDKGCNPSANLEGLDPIIIWGDKHKNKDGSWVNETARQKFEEMMELRLQIAPEGCRPTAEQERHIFRRVLGVRRDYLIGLGPSQPSPSMPSQNQSQLSEALLKSQDKSIANLKRKVKEQNKQWKDAFAAVIGSLTAAQIPNLTIPNISLPDEDEDANEDEDEDGDGDGDEDEDEYDVGLDDYD